MEMKAKFNKTIFKNIQTQTLIQKKKGESFTTSPFIILNKLCQSYSGYLSRNKYK